MNLSDKKVLVVGLGTLGGGVGTVRYLAQQGAFVHVTDLKSEKELENSVTALKSQKITYTLGRHDDNDLDEVSLIIKNPGVPTNSSLIKIARDKNIPIEMAESLFMKLSPTKNIVGVTGTRGKSTTASMIYELLKNGGNKTYLAGNVPGTSTLALLDEIDSDSYVVLELSSWMLESFGWHHISPRFAVITNIYPDHLNRYASMKEYIQDKKNIYLSQSTDDHLFLNKGDTYANTFAHETKSSVHWFDDNSLDASLNLMIPGDHNRANAAAALSVATLLGVQAGSSRNTLSHFSGLPYRLEKVANINGVTYINDSASTTPIAAITALKAYRKRPIVLIAGGNSKNLPMGQFVDYINTRTKHAVLFDGTAWDDFVHVQRKSGPIPIGNMTLAVENAYKHAEKGDVVLFSPGVTHLPILNEFERGDIYKKEIYRLQTAKK